MQRKTIVVEQGTDATHQQDLAVLVVATVAAALDVAQLGKLLLPIAQYMLLDAGQLADFTDGEIAFGRNGRKLSLGYLHDVVQPFP
ncbi:hypothetical protein D3C78_1313270 [compost metagenome]